ncbi:unnamed protein product, partial [Ixodes hexagonus]
GFEVVCRLAHESFHRAGGMRFRLEDVPACMCTQLLFGSISNYLNGKVYWSYLAPVCKENLKKFICFKRRYPHLKTIVELSYWNARWNLRRMVARPASRRIFTADIMKFILDFGFDGLSVFIGEEPFELLNRYTKDNLAAFLRELSAVFKPAGKLLSTTFRGTKNMQDFAMKIEPYVDFIYIMAFRMRQNNLRQTGIHTQLHPLDSDPQKYKVHNIETYVRTLAHVVPKHKLLPVLAFTGTSFRLASRNSHEFYDRTIPGFLVYKGRYTKDPLAIAFFETCRLYHDNKWTHAWDYRYSTTYVYSNNYWIAYDDARSIRIKMDWLVREGVGGVVAWSIDKDDFTGGCDGGPYPLLRAI